MLKPLAARVAVATLTIAGLLGQSNAVAAPNVALRPIVPHSIGRPLGSARPLATSTEYFVYGGTLAAAQWRTWLSANPTGCYVPVGTGEAQDAFYSGGLTQAPASPGDCGYTTSYPRIDFAAGDAPLTSYKIYLYGQKFLAKRGPAIVAPVAGAALAQAYSTRANGSGTSLPSRLEISNVDLCKIWNGTTTDWSNVTNQATGGRVTGASLPISLVVRSDGSGSTFIHTAHLNTVCGGYPVGTSFPPSRGNAKIIGVKGSGLVASTTAATPGAIGYVGPQYLAGTELAAALQNKSGGYKIPTSYAVFSAFASPLDTTPPPGYPAPSNTQVDLYLTNPSNSNAYPEVGFTYTYVFKCYPAASGSPSSPSTAFLRSVFIHNYNTAPTEAGLVQLPSNIANAAFAAINEIGTGTSYSTSTGRCQ